MGVAVFAPCLLFVVADGCFSLPADAARRLKQLPKKKKKKQPRCLVEEEMSIKRGKGASRARCEFVRCRKTTEKIEQKDRKYRRDRKKRAVMLG